MVDGNVEMTLTPKIDTSQVEKDMKKVAENSKTAVSKSMEDLTKSISQAMQMAQEDVEKLGNNDSISDIFKRAADAVQLFNERRKDIRAMGQLDPDIAKLHALELKLNGAARNILNLQADWEKLVDTMDATNAIEAAYGSLEKAQERVEELRKTIAELTAEVSHVDFSPETFVSLYDQSQEIESTRAHLKELIAERKELENSHDKGTETWTRHMELLDQLIPEVTRDLAAMSKEFYKTGRDAGLGQNKDDINETFENMKKLADATAEYRSALVAVQQVANDDILARQTITSLAQSSTKFDKIIKQIQSIAGQTEEVRNGVRGVGREAEHTGSTFSQWRNVVWSVSRVLGSVYTVSLDVVRGAQKIANFYKRIWGYVVQIHNAIKKWRSGILGTAVDHAKSFKDMLRDIIRYSLGIRSLFALFRRLRKYIKEAFEEMAKQIPEVENVLSGLKSSLGMLKGSLATAFEPIVSAVAPMLNLLIEKLAKAMTYIGMFFAALTGRGYVYQATKNMQHFTKQTEKANKQLQKFDELNNITTQKNKKDDDEPIAIFKKVPVPDWLKNLADLIKSILKKIIDPIKKAWALVGEYVKWAWLRAFNAVKKFLLDVGRDFLKAWEKWGTPIFIRIFQIIGDIGETIANLADALDEAWNAEDNGYKIWSAILEIVYKIISGIRKITKDIRDWTFTLDLTPAMTAFREWLESLVPVAEMFMDILYDIWDDALKPILTWAFDGENSGIARLFRIFTDFNDKLDKSHIQKNLDKIWKAIGRFGQTVGEGLLTFIERLSDRIANWVNSDKFTAFCDKIVVFLDNIKPGDIVDRLEQVLRILGNILEFIWDAIEYVKEFEFMGKDILDWVEVLSENLDTIAKMAVFGKLAIDLMRFGANVILLFGSILRFVGPNGLLAVGVMGLVAAIAGYVFTFVDMWKNGINDVEAIFMSFCGVVATVLAGLIFGPIGAIVAAIVVAIAGIVLIIHDNWDKIVSWWTDTVLPWLKSIGEAILVGVVSFVQDIWVAIQTVVFAIWGIITGIVSAVVGIINGAVELIVNIILGIINYIISILEAVGTTIKSFIQAIVTGSTEPLYKIKDAWVNVWTSLKDLLKGIWNGIASIVEGAINGILKGIETFVNGVIGAANRAASAIASVPGFSGGIRQFATVSLPRVTIPRLAEGAVIPPNKEFLAVLGDQKSGTNIESPLSTMVEAFNQAGGNRSEQELTLLQEQNQLLRQFLEKEWTISASQMFSAMQRQAVVYTKQSGRPAF